MSFKYMPVFKLAVLPKRMLGNILMVGGFLKLGNSNKSKMNSKNLPGLLTMHRL
jgi:hypothetical protein